MSAPGLGDVEVTLTIPGGPTRRLNPDLTTARWTTAATGGYGSFNCQFPGRISRRDLPHLARIQVTVGQRVLFDGRLEDHELSLDTTSIQAFGWQRLLDETGINKTWVKRDLPWQQWYQTGQGMTVGIGAFDQADPTNIGVRLTGDDPANTAVGAMAFTILPVAGSTLKFDYTHNGDTGMVGYVIGVTDGVLDSVNLGTSDGAKTYTLPVGCDYVFFLYVGTPTTPPIDADTDRVDFTNIRMVGPTVTEDAAGGIYAGTVIRDLLDSVPGLTAGRIDDGTEFLIEHIDRTTPSGARAVLDELNSYHDREWAVWDNKQLDWLNPNPDQPDWVIPSTDFQELRIRSSTDPVARTVKLIFNDPAQAANVPGAQQLITSVEAESTDPRNPYVRTSQTKDLIITTGFPMTTTSAQALADKLARLQGGPPPATGNGVIHTDTPIRTRDGSVYPAWALRAGEDILIPDLPVDEPFRTGRDGQTLFHVVTCDVNLDDRTVTVELDGQGRRADVLMARLAAVTKTVTG